MNINVEVSFIAYTLFIDRISHIIAGNIQLLAVGQRGPLRLLYSVYIDLENFENLEKSGEFEIDL